METPTLINTPEVTIPQTEAAPLSPLRKWGSLVVLSLALAIIVIDTTLLNVSLKTVINDLHTDIESMQWVITAYSLVLAAFTITGGRLGDLFGRKKMFILGAIIFAIGSFIASISKGVGTMIAGEAIIEGIGAALMMPATASILVANFKGKERSIAFGIWGGIAAASSAIGPILGGWLTTNYSWRWGFRINVVVAAILVLGSLIVRESKDTEEKSRLDILGVLLSAIGMLSIVFAFIKANTYGWLKAKADLVVFHHTISFGDLSSTPVFIGIGLLFLVAFVLWQRYLESKGKTPLVSLELLKNYQFTVGTLTTAVISLGMAGLIFSIPVFLQTVRNLDALHTGLTMLPLSIALLVAAPIAGFLGHKIGAKRIILTGLALNTFGYLVMRYILNVDSTALGLAPGFIVLGVGMGLTMSQISNITLSAVSVQQAGEASGVNNTMRQVGQTLGTAILGAILISTLTSHIASGVRNSEKIPTQMRQAIADKVSDQASNIEFSGAAPLPAGTPEYIKTEISTIAKQATTDANKVTLLFGALFSFLGFLIAFFLKGEKDAKAEVSAAAPTNPNDLVPMKHVIIGSAIAVAIIAGMSGVLGYYIHKDKTAAPAVSTLVVPPPTTELSNTPPSLVNNFPQPTTTEPDSGAMLHMPITNVPTPEQNTVNPNSPRPTPPPTGGPAPTPPPTNTSTRPTKITDPSWNVSFAAPAGVTLAVSEASATAHAYFNVQTKELFGLLDRYPTDGSVNLDTIKQQLAASPDISNIVQSSFQNLPALSFTNNKTGKLGLAVIVNQTIFYLSGSLLDPGVIDTLKLQ